MTSGIKSWRVRAWIVLAVLAGVGGGYIATRKAPIQRIQITRPVVVQHPTVVRVGGTTISDARCGKVRRGMTFNQVTKEYGWPTKLSDSARGQWTLQVVDHNELDYPVTSSLHDPYIRLCGVIFIHNRVDHVWEDLP